MVEQGEDVPHRSRDVQIDVRPRHRPAEIGQHDRALADDHADRLAAGDGDREALEIEGGPARGAADLRHRRQVVDREAGGRDGSGEPADVDAAGAGGEGEIETGFRKDALGERGHRPGAGIVRQRRRPVARQIVGREIVDSDGHGAGDRLTDAVDDAADGELRTGEIDRQGIHLQAAVVTEIPSLAGHRGDREDMLDRGGDRERLSLGEGDLDIVDLDRRAVPPVPAAQLTVPHRKPQRRRRQADVPGDGRRQGKGTAAADHVDADLDDGSDAVHGQPHRAAQRQIEVGELPQGRGEGSERGRPQIVEADGQIQLVGRSLVGPDHRQLSLLAVQRRGQEGLGADTGSVMPQTGLPDPARRHEPESLVGEAELGIDDPHPFQIAHRSTRIGRGEQIGEQATDERARLRSLVGDLHVQGAVGPPAQGQARSEQLDVDRRDDTAQQRAVVQSHRHFRQPGDDLAARADGAHVAEPDIEGPFPPVPEQDRVAEPEPERMLLGIEQRLDRRRQEGERDRSLRQPPGHAARNHSQHQDQAAEQIGADPHCSPDHRLLPHPLRRRPVPRRLDPLAQCAQCARNWTPRP